MLNHICGLKQRQLAAVAGVSCILGVIVIGILRRNSLTVYGSETAHVHTVIYNSSNELPRSKSCQKFHLVVMYFKMSYKNQSASTLLSRNREFWETLRLNLKHSCVRKVHLFYLNQEDLKEVITYLESKGDGNLDKLYPVKRTKPIQMADFFTYASKELIGKATIASNADMVLGEGFDLIDTEKLEKERIIYSLSWPTLYYKVCPHSTTSRCGNYYGSHDTHIFQLEKPLDVEQLKPLEYAINIQQAENGMIYTMRHAFNFVVKNPCLTVKTYHYHCSSFRPVASHDSILNHGWTGNQLGMAEPDTL